MPKETPVTEEPKIEQPVVTGQEQTNTGGEGGTPPAAVTPAPAAQPNLNDLNIKLDHINRLIVGQASKETIDSEYSRLEEQSGFTRQNLEYLGQAMPHIVSQYVAPILEANHKESAKAILGKNPELFGQVELIMASQSPQMRANKEAWENAAYIVKGKNPQLFAPPAKNNGGGSNRTIVGGNVDGLARPTDNSGTPQPKKYDADEKSMIDMYFNGDAKEYERYTSTKEVEKLRPSPKMKDAFKKTE